MAHEMVILHYEATIVTRLTNLHSYSDCMLGVTVFGMWLVELMLEIQSMGGG